MPACLPAKLDVVAGLRPALPRSCVTAVAVRPAAYHSLRPLTGPCPQLRAGGVAGAAGAAVRAHRTLLHRRCVAQALGTCLYASRLVYSAVVGELHSGGRVLLSHRLAGFRLLTHPVPAMPPHPQMWWW